jgi:hypothetical protein
MAVLIQIHKIHSITEDSSLEKEIQNLLGISNPIDSIREELLSESLNNEWARNYDPLINYLQNSDCSSENEPYNYELDNDAVQKLIADFKEELDTSIEKRNLSVLDIIDCIAALQKYLNVFEKVQNDNQIILVSVNW